MVLFFALFLISACITREPESDRDGSDQAAVPAETGQEDQSDPEEDLKLDYVDAYGKHYTAVINPDLKMHSYDPDCLKRKGKNGISYKGDENYRIRRGLDVSFHQGNINWKKVKKAGYEFAFIRVGARAYGKEGQLISDTQFEANIKGAQKAGLDVGVYFFSQAVNKKEALEEAKLTIKRLKGYKLQLPVVFNPEKIRGDKARTDKVSGKQFTDNTIAFCEKIKKAGYDPMIYSNMVWEDQIFEMERLQDYPFWYADYEKKPQTPYDFTFWQYTEKGTAPGIDGNVDLDVEFIKEKKAD